MCVVTCVCPHAYNDVCMVACVAHMTMYMWSLTLMVTCARAHTHGRVCMVTYMRSCTQDGVACNCNTCLLGPSPSVLCVCSGPPAPSSSPWRDTPAAPGLGQSCFAHCQQPIMLTVTLLIPGNLTSKKSLDGIKRGIQNIVNVDDPGCYRFGHILPTRD